MDATALGRGSNRSGCGIGRRRRSLGVSGLGARSRRRSLGVSSRSRCGIGRGLRGGSRRSGLLGRVLLGGLADPFANQSGASDSFVLGQLAAVDGGDDVDDRNAFCDAALVLLDADFAVAFADLGALALQPLASEIVDKAGRG